MIEPLDVWLLGSRGCVKERGRQVLKFAPYTQRRVLTLHQGFVFIFPLIKEGHEPFEELSCKKNTQG